jgi:hypothetical protein
MTPATAISVNTYGSAWKRVAVDSENVGRRLARALEKPNSSVAASAPAGRHFPKITAASAMNPRPSVMFWLNDPTNATDRYAPPSAASIPDVVTAM